MSDVAKKTVDIDDTLYSKLSDKTKYVPRFAARQLKKITHQDEMNQFLWESKNLTGVDWLEARVQYLDASLEVKGRESLPNPRDGRLYIFASDHPLGGVDGIVSGAIIGRHHGGRIKHLLNDLLMSLPGLHLSSISINKTDKQGHNSPAVVDVTFQSDNHVIIFPAGLYPRKINGQIRGIPWKKTFTIESVEYQRGVVSIHFKGRNSGRFYRITNICKALRLKFDVAMLFLVDEIYRNRHKTFRVTIGKPIPWQTFDERKNAQ